MKEIEELIVSRLTGDTGAGETLQTFLGNTDRILNGKQIQPSKVPSLVFSKFFENPGTLYTEGPVSWESFYLFQIFSDRYTEIAFRIKRLLDNFQYTVPEANTDIGSLVSLFDWEGEDDFDEDLRVGRKDMRFRFFSTMKANDPI